MILLIKPRSTICKVDALTIRLLDHMPIINHLLQFTGIKLKGAKIRNNPLTAFKMLDTTNLVIFTNTRFLNIILSNHWSSAVSFPLLSFS